MGIYFRRQGSTHYYFLRVIHGGALPLGNNATRSGHTGLGHSPRAQCHRRRSTVRGRKYFSWANRGAAYSEAVHCHHDALANHGHHDGWFRNNRRQRYGCIYRHAWRRSRNRAHSDGQTFNDRQRYVRASRLGHGQTHAA